MTVKKKTAFLALSISAFLTLFIFALFAARSLNRGLGIRSFIVSIPSMLRAVANQDNVKAYNRGDFTNLIFLHHSVGQNLIERGGLRDYFRQKGFNLWDQDYNYSGLHDPNGNSTGYGYNIPNDNTDPDGLERIFNARLYDAPWNTFSGLMQHEVIIFKSCFPASNITSIEQFERYQAWYRDIHKVIVRHPEKLFVVLTPPPLNPAETTPEAAGRARQFADWLKSGDFLAGAPNMVTFDLFNELAESDSSAPDRNMLRQDYREGSDSHPNATGDQVVAPMLAEFIIQSIETYRQSYAAQEVNVGGATIGLKVIPVTKSFAR